MVKRIDARIKKGNSAGVKPGVIASDLSSPDFNLPFFAYVTTAANVTRNEPSINEISLPIGRVNRLWVEFPKGCAGLVGLQVYRGVDQIFPLPSETWLRSDNAVMNFAFTHLIKSEPNTITIQTYNEDDTYQHTIWLCFEMSGFIGELTPEMQAFIKTLTGRGG